MNAEASLPTPATAPPLAQTSPPATVPFLEGVVFATGTPKSLIKKLSQVMGVIRRVQKNGTNTQQNYAYATEADIVAEVRTAMAERELLMVPTVVGAKWDDKTTKSGAQMKICTLRVRFTLFDGEAGESLSFEVFGQGEDTGDKATYKAMTGALKYALLKMFLIPTGDDPEHAGTVTPPAPSSGAAGLKAALSAPNIHAAAQAAAAHPSAPRPPDGRTHDGNFVIAFSNKDKEALWQLSEKNLKWFEGALITSIAAPEKAKFAASNTQLLALVRAELNFRGLS